MVDRNHENFLVLFVSFGLSDVDFFYEHIGLISVTVQNSKIKNTNFMDLLDIKLMWTQISSDIMTFDKLLQRAVFSFESFKISLGATFNRERINNFFVVERRVIKLYVCSWRDFMKLVNIEQKGSNLSSGSLTTKNSFSNPVSA